MSFEEYWIGKGVNFDELWSNYENGQPYIDKFRSMDVYLLQLSFEQYSNRLIDYQMNKITLRSKIGRI